MDFDRIRKACACGCRQRGWLCASAGARAGCRRFLPRQAHHARHRLRHRRRLRHLCAHARRASSATHIPGKPTIVPQNMPGAGSRSAANWLYKVAPQGRHRDRDAGPGHADRPGAGPARRPVRRAQVQLDRQHGASSTTFCSCRRASRRRDARRGQDQAAGDRRHRRKLALGALSAGLQQPARHQVPIISGYPGGGDINIAVERREVDGRGSDSWASMQGDTRRTGCATTPSTSCSRSGPEREPDLPDVPLWSELAAE